MLAERMETPSIHRIFYDSRYKTKLVGYKGRYSEGNKLFSITKHCIGENH